MVALAIILGFVALAYFTSIYSDNLKRKKRNIVLHLISILLFLFFGLVSVVFLGLLFDPNVKVGIPFIIVWITGFAIFCGFQLKDRREFNKLNQNRSNSSKERSVGNSEQVVKDFPLDVERIDNTSIDLVSFVKEKNTKATEPQQISPTFNKQVEISFRYEDSEGNITDRNIMLQKKRPPYFSGFCLDRNAKRTFRRDRVLEFYGESKKHYDTFSKSKHRKITQQKKEKVRLQVCFVGFDKNDLKLLNALAKAHNIKVMRSVTKNLFALVYEGNIDKSREQRALERGALLMDKDAFLNFVDTGEI